MVIARGNVLIDGCFQLDVQKQWSACEFWEKLFKSRNGLALADVDLRPQLLVRDVEDVAICAAIDALVELAVVATVDNHGYVVFWQPDLNMKKKVRKKVR